jgi:hypothetical protein
LSWLLHPKPGLYSICYQKHIYIHLIVQSFCNINQYMQNNCNAWHNCVYWDKNVRPQLPQIFRPNRMQTKKKNHNWNTAEKL